MTGYRGIKKCIKCLASECIINTSSARSCCVLRFARNGKMAAVYIFNPTGCDSLNAGISKFSFINCIFFFFVAIYFEKKKKKERENTERNKEEETKLNNFHLNYNDTKKSIFFFNII